MKKKKIIKFEIIKKNWGETMSHSVTPTTTSFNPESMADEDLANKLNEIIDYLNSLSSKGKECLCVCHNYDETVWNDTCCKNPKPSSQIEHLSPKEEVG